MTFVSRKLDKIATQILHLGLSMETFTYTSPVAKLLTLGSKHDLKVAWPNYLKMGFTHEHIPELIRLVQDFELANLPWDENEQESAAVYGQMHAWRTLTQLQAIEAIPVMLNLFHSLDDNFDDYISTEVPRALGILGEAALTPSYELLKDQVRSTTARIHAASTLAEIGRRHPGLRRTCVRLFIDALVEYKNNDAGVNSFIILGLATLKSQEAALLVEKVIREGLSDTCFSGSYRTYQASLGLLN